jgi:hypothetical protein
VADQKQHGEAALVETIGRLEKAIERTLDVLNEMTSKSGGFREHEILENKRLVVAGYIFALLPILAFPNLFAQVAVALGVATIIKGQMRHGIAMMVVGTLMAMLGVLVGGPGELG